MEERKVAVYIATSIDGYIAGPADNLDFLQLAEMPNEDYGYKDFMTSIDTIIMGHNTYKKVLSFDSDFPYVDKDCYVVSRTVQGVDKYVDYYAGDLSQLISKIRQARGSNIYCDGGEMLISALLNQKLLNEITITIIPIVLGEGKKLFGITQYGINMKLMHCKHYPNGVVQLKYSVTE